MAQVKSHKPPEMALCRGCGQFVRAYEVDCPHCEENLVASAVRYNRQREEAAAAEKKLKEILRQLNIPLEQ